MDINLIMIKSNGSQKVLPLPSNVTVIGRRSDCDLRIPLMSVSKHHCQLSHSAGKLRVRDLGSRNGTNLNGKLINETLVQAGDLLEIGPVKFVFQIDGKPEIIDIPEFTATASAKKSAQAQPQTKKQTDQVHKLGNAIKNELEEMDDVGQFDDTHEVEKGEERLDDIMDEFGDLDDFEDLDSL